MALSPAVVTKEKDLTFNTQSVTSNATGYVGLFRWGPVDEVVEITTNEAELVQRFGQPDALTTSYFHAAANYMNYCVPLYVVRAVGTDARNSIPADAKAADVEAVLVKNKDHLDTVNLDGISFIGRYPGDIANTLKVSACDATGFATWAYADSFEYAPVGDAFNMVVVDEDGLLTGSKGAVIERYELMTKTPASKKTDGSSAYVVEVVKNQSQYLFAGDVDAIVFEDGVYEQSMVDGVSDDVADNADFVTAWEKFENVDEVELTRFFTSFNPLPATIAAIDIAESRGDAVAFNACRLADVYNTVDRVDNTVEYFTEILNKPTSYAFNVDNWKMVYDKYNDKYIWIPCDSDAAGLHARLFVLNEPWFSPAGLNRGQLKNVIKLAWSSNQPQRDVLYRYSVNSIVAFKGEGTVLFGDKTALMAPSAFSRINVRTLFIVIKKAISRAARYQLFELNDFITQALFRNATNAYLEDIQARRGLYDKRVVCDGTNNTPQVIDSNEFVGDVYLKPSRSINVIRLNFTAVATGVDFSEFEGA